MVEPNFDPNHLDFPATLPPVQLWVQSWRGQTLDRSPSLIDKDKREATDGLQTDSPTKFVTGKNVSRYGQMSLGVEGANSLVLTINGVRTYGEKAYSMDQKSWTLM